MKLVTFVAFISIPLLPATHSVIWPCENTEDCSLANDAICSALGLCECSQGYLLSEDLTKCIKISLYGEECEEHIQCSHMPSGAKCLKGICKCDEGFQYIHGRCRRFSLLNGPCSQNIDCFFGYDRESVACDSGVCRCANGFYERYTNICRMQSNEIGDPCVVNEDCHTSDLQCNNFKCESINEQKLTKDVAVQTNIGNYELKLLARDYKELNETEILLRTQPKSAVRDNCSNNGQPCNELPHSLCANNQCVCMLGYYEEDGVCNAELGEQTEDEHLCKHVFNADKKLCLCEKNYFYEAGLRECRKPIIPIDGRCTSDSQCSAFGASYCREERPRICDCYNYAKFDEAREMCIPTEGLGAYCEDSTACHLENTVCSKEKVCVCKDMFIEKNGACSPNIGGECRTDEECVVENTVCVSPPNNFKDKNDANVCSCKSGYVHFQEMCLKEATETDEECVDKIQCKPLLGQLAQCLDNKCGCGAEYHLNAEQCHEKKLLGDSCKKTTECFAEQNSSMLECRNAVCRCQFGYNTDTERKLCIAPKSGSSGRPSPLKVITLLLITSAFLITSAAIKQAYL